MKTEKFFDFRLIGIGLVFLMDFNVDTVDFLPDSIGLALISAGIGKGFYTSDNLAKAKKYINVFYAPALAKFGWNIVYIALDLKKTDASAMLLLTTVFSGFELVLGFLVFANIFAAFDGFFVVGGQGKISKEIGILSQSVKIFYGFQICVFGIAAYPGAFDRRSLGWPEPFL